MADTAGTWDWWGSFGGLARTETKSDRLRRERLAVQYIEYIRAREFTLANKMQLGHPNLVKDINAGKYDYLPGFYRARVGEPIPGQPKPTRKGDIFLKSPVDKLGAIGAPMRKVALGVLGRVAGPASWALLGASLLPAGYLERFGKELANLPPAPFPRIPGGLPPGPKSFPDRAPRTVMTPVAEASGRFLVGLLDPTRPPAAPNPRLIPKKRPALSQVKVTAKKIPVPKLKTPAAAASAAAPLAWWKQLIKDSFPSLALAYLKRERPAPAPRINVGPFALSPAQPLPGQMPDPLTPVGSDGASCDCKPKPRKPREPRTKCRTGRFIERFSGIQKYETRSVTCRPSRKKQS